MNAFESLALALRGHFENPFSQLPPELQQRVVTDFAPWSWEGKSPRQRCHRAKQWDYENDPARREVREGIEVLTNPDSPAYSLDETQRLRGDFLPEPRIVQPIIDLPPLEWDDTPPYFLPGNNVGVSPDAPTTDANLTNSTGLAAPANELTHERNKRRWQMCIDAGLKMPDNDYKTLPKGIGVLAEKEGISQQAFSKSVKAHIARKR